MRSRIALLWSVLTVIALALPAAAQAESFPSKAGNFVSDNVEYFVGGLVAAILLLLLIVSIKQRRAKEKAKKAPPPATPLPPQVTPPAAGTEGQTAEMPAMQKTAGAPGPSAASVPPFDTGVPASAKERRKLAREQQRPPRLEHRKGRQAEAK